MAKGINIRYSNTWFRSYKIIIEKLKESGYFSDHPLLYLNFSSDYNNLSMTVLNKKVSHIIDKVEMNKLFDVYEILHPKTYYYPFTDLPKKGECVIKERYGKGKGRGLKFSFFERININNLDESNYIQHYIPFITEYRVVNFIGNYRCRLKIGNDKLKNSNTCRYKNFRHERLERFASLVCNKFGIDYGGLDIGLINNHYYMIEINSASGLNNNSANSLLYFLIKYYDEHYYDM